MTSRRAGMSSAELGKGLHTLIEHMLADREAIPWWEARKPEPTPEPPAPGLNRATRRAHLGNTIGYPLRSGNKASRRQGARMAWRHGVILAMRKAQAEALAEKVK